MAATPEFDSLPATSLARGPRPAIPPERSLSTALMFVVVLISLSIIAVLSKVLPADGAEMNYHDLMNQLDRDALIRQALIPQIVTGLFCLGVVAWLGWFGRIRLSLGRNVRSWILIVGVAVAMISLLDYDFFRSKDAATVITIFATFLAVGFTEELLYRGIVLEGMHQRHTLGRAVLYSGGIFGASHLLNILQGNSVGQGIGQAIFTTIMGTMFGLLCVKTGSLIAAMVLHGLWDILMVNRIETLSGVLPATMVALCIGFTAFLLMLAFHRQIQELLCRLTPEQEVSTNRPL